MATRAPLFRDEIESLTRRKAWRNLESHYRKMSRAHLRTLFAENPKRGEQFALEALGIYLDYSKNRVTDETLNLLIQLAEESGLRSRINSMFLGEKWNQTTEWHDKPCHEDMVQLIARASARCFVGEEAARNPEWIKIAIEHSAHLQSAAEQLRRWPALLRPIVERFAPTYRAVRAEYQRATELLAPFIKARQEELQAAAAENRAPKVPQDFFEFARTTAKSGNYSDVNLQLGAAFSATQTTADILAQALLHLAQHPEDQEALREETIAVLGKHGMNKNALTEAHLMDSYIKETQRLKPSFISESATTCKTNVC